MASSPPSAHRSSSPFPALRQPDGMTCGPTSIKIVCEHLGVHRNLDIHDVATICRTNGRFGTTYEAMCEAVDILGLTWRRPVRQSISGLRESLAEGNVTMLRTLIGTIPHWVVAYGAENSGIRISCPSSGRIVIGDDELLRRWEGRYFDGFEVPSDLALHPGVAVAGAAVDAALSAPAPSFRDAPVHTMTLDEFREGRPVTADADQRPWFHAVVARSAEQLRKLAAAKPNGRFAPMAFRSDDLLFLKERGTMGLCTMLALEKNTGRLVGGCFSGNRWVAEEFRGRGYGVEIALAAYSETGQRFLFPQSFTEAGWGSRIAAHRVAVQRAQDAG